MSVELLHALSAKVDAFFDRVKGRHGDEMSCDAGCHDCCAPGLTVTGVEAAVIRAELASLAPEHRETLRARAARPDPTRCAALGVDGRCGIYLCRPLVCRSHGVPIRLRTPGSLPIVDACPRNFVADGPGVAEPDCVLDQATMSTMLAAVDGAHARATGRPAGERIALQALLLELTPA